MWSAIVAKRRYAPLWVTVGLVLALGTVLLCNASGTDPNCTTCYADSAGPTSQPNASASVSVTGTINAKRLVIVDGGDTIIAIWSNTTSSDHGFMVRERSINGPEHPITDSILSQYKALLDDIDWTQRGRVFTRQVH